MKTTREACLSVTNVFIYTSLSFHGVFSIYRVLQAELKGQVENKRGSVFLRVAKAGTKVRWPQRAGQPWAWGEGLLTLTSPVKVHSPFWLDSRISTLQKPY